MTKVGEFPIQRSDGDYDWIELHEPGTFDHDPVLMQASNGNYGTPYLRPLGEGDTGLLAQASSGAWYQVNKLGVRIIDNWEHASRDPYWIEHTSGDFTPYTQSTHAYNETYGWRHDNRANYAISLPSDHPNYSSSTQSVVLDNYTGPGKITEMWMKPLSFGSNPLTRLLYCPSDYSSSTSDWFRIAIRDGYWSLRHGSSVMTASDGSFAEDNNIGTVDMDAWQRVVLDLQDYPTHYAHLYDSNDNHVSELEAENSTHDYDGFGTWANDNTDVVYDYFNLIDRSQFHGASY